MEERLESLSGKKLPLPKERCRLLYMIVEDIENGESTVNVLLAKLEDYNKEYHIPKDIIDKSLGIIDAINSKYHKQSEQNL